MSEEAEPTVAPAKTIRRMGGDAYHAFLVKLQADQMTLQQRLKEGVRVETIATELECSESTLRRAFVTLGIKFGSALKAEKPPEQVPTSDQPNDRLLFAIGITVLRMSQLSGLKSPELEAELFPEPVVNQEEFFKS